MSPVQTCIYCWTDSENIQSNDNNIGEKILSEFLVLLPVLPVWHQLPFILHYVYKTIYRPNSLRIGRQYISSVQRKCLLTSCFLPKLEQACFYIYIKYIYKHMYICMYACMHAHMRLSYPKLIVLLKCHSLCM